MSGPLPNSSEFRWRILALYYGISLPGPAVLVASLFALLDLTGVHHRSDCDLFESLLRRPGC
jgi:hypothetical protein